MAGHNPQSTTVRREGGSADPRIWGPRPVPQENREPQNRKADYPLLGDLDLRPT